VTSTGIIAEPRHCSGVRLGRFSFGLTGRGLGLLLLGTLWLVPAFFVHRFAWAVLIWDATVLVICLFDGLQLPAPSLIEGMRKWMSVAALESETEVELSIVQHGRYLLFCRLMDDLPAAFLETPRWLEAACYPNVPCALRYTFVPRARGDHAAGKLYLRYRSSIGLLERWSMVDLTQTVRTYPATGAGIGQSLFLARTRQIELQLRKHRQRGLGREFEALRDYRQGDDLRDVCWKASARRGALITKQYQTERSQAVWLLLDAGRLLQGRVGRYTKLDYATATALAMAQLALVSGDRVGLLAYGRETQQLIAPARGGTHLRQIMESLALVRGEAAEADHLRATVTLNRLQPRRSLVLWLTDPAETSMQPEVAEGAAQLMRRHLVLFVAMEQRDLRKIAAARPDNPQQMFTGAAAQEMVRWRELLLARLRQRGALTLETYPEEMTYFVLNRYLEIKERAML
jgi:uncharacterized protein (DUF58 family)